MRHAAGPSRRGRRGGSLRLASGVLAQPAAGDGNQLLVGGNLATRSANHAGGLRRAAEILDRSLARRAGFAARNDDPRMLVWFLHRLLDHSRAATERSISFGRRDSWAVWNRRRGWDSLRTDSRKDRRPSWTGRPH